MPLRRIGIGDRALLIFNINTRWKWVGLHALAALLLRRLLLVPIAVIGCLFLEFLVWYKFCLWKKNFRQVCHLFKAVWLMLKNLLV